MPTPAIATRTVFSEIGFSGDSLMRLLLRFGRRAVPSRFLRDQLVDPIEIVLGGPGPVLEERPGVTVDGAGRGLALGDQPLGELGAAAFEERQAGGGVEVAAEQELHGEGALVVVALVGQQLGEQRPARGR